MMIKKGMNIDRLKYSRIAKIRLKTNYTWDRYNCQILALNMSRLDELTADSGRAFY